MADPLFNLIIDDTSPLITYSPFSDTFTAPNIPGGWNPYYTDSGFAQRSSGNGSDIIAAIGNGTSLHLTAHDGAFLQISWNGASSCSSCHPTCPSFLRTHRRASMRRPSLPRCSLPSVYRGAREGIRSSRG